MDDFLIWVQVLFGFTVSAVFIVKQLHLSKNGKDISPHLKRGVWAAARCSGNLMLMLFKALFILGQNLFFKIVRR